MSKLRLAARVSAILLLLSVGLVIEANLAYAQSSNANLSGVVTDVSGAVIVDAQLTLSNTASKSVSTYQSDAGGRYVFRDVQPGTYSLQVAKTGFETTVQTGIVLTINASAHADITLKVGAGSQRVEVQDSTTSLVNYDNATVQGGIEPQTLSALPIAIANGNQRSSAQLAVLLPGVTTSSGGDAYNARINGGQQSGDEAILDGATLSEGYLNQSGMVAIHTDFPVSPDMISELKVVTSTYEPQYGFTTSGQIVAETKRGGTSFHGSAYAYLRNDGLNAIQWGLPAGTPRTFDHEMDAGANIGGPIKLPRFNTGKNKGFFFCNWEPYTLNGGAQRPTLTIPTLKERAGDFTDNVVDGKLVPIYDPRTGQQFSCNGVLNVICPNLEDPIAKAWLAQLPTPTNSGTSNNYLAPHAVPNSLYTGSDAYLFRIDDNWGDLDRFAFSFYRRYNNSNLASALPTSISSAQGQPGHSGVYRFNWEHAFSGKTLNHFTLGYLDLHEDILSADTESTVKMPTVPGVANTTTYLPTFNIGDLQFGENRGSPGNDISTRPTWAINDIFSRVVGSHTLVAGLEWRSAQGNANGGTNQGGTFSFGGVTANNNSTDPANSNADFFIGAANGGSVSYYNVPAIYVRQTAWAVHLGDTWRFSL